MFDYIYNNDTNFKFSIPEFKLIDLKNHFVGWTPNESGSWYLDYCWVNENGSVTDTLTIKDVTGNNSEWIQKLGKLPDISKNTSSMLICRLYRVK